ncbi:hypothetical protein VNI00_002146 [Paramarasmius palmivorus]|uniref:Uncharacterized protein n=1 Tax=Paramarasmius palmivorus TaxID=297713 RepID=A0AAW0E716_9AGAR
MEPLRRLFIVAFGILLALGGFSLSVIGCVVNFFRGPKPVPKATRDIAPLALPKSPDSRSVHSIESSASESDLPITPTHSPSSSLSPRTPRSGCRKARRTTTGGQPTPVIIAVSESPGSPKVNKWLHINPGRSSSESDRSSLKENISHNFTMGLRKSSFMNLRRVPSAPGSNPATASFRRRCKWITKHPRPVDRPRTRPYEAPYFLPLPNASTPVRLATILKELDIETSSPTTSQN